MSEQDQEQKTEQPTGKQREKFRDRGDVGKSRDVAAVVSIAGGTAALVFCWSGMASSVITISSGILGRLDGHGKAALVSIAGAKMFLAIVAPVAVTVLVLGIAAELAQVGFHPNLQPLVPDLTRLNPLPRFRQLFFSSGTAIELVKSFVKVVVIGALAYGVLSDELTGQARLVGLVPIEIFARLGRLVLRITIFVGLAMAAVALVDLLIERYRYIERMKMTKDEVKQELKESEGDPLVRNRLRTKQRDLSRRRMLSSIRTADVVVVNPTHYSVALRYRMSVDAAPMIVARGGDELAARIRELARHHGVPVVSDPPLARALFRKGRLYGPIPAELYRAVAALLAWVYSVRSRSA
ncbi:MAG: EscU/YscU/HrcU family type III secretion system export apparatus switch protein [Deltaproteobacteria bacterium]|nr:EscU/YscU/HrcU family type III secretion system export apparatus switch protein [Deltaproteobacteria bacterium]